MTTMALLSSSPTPTLSSKSHSIHHKSYLNNTNNNTNTNNLPFNKPRKPQLLIRVSASENGANVVTATTTTTTDDDVPAASDTPVVQVKDVSSSSNNKFEKSEDSVGPTEDVSGSVTGVNKFKDFRWVNGTWDLKMFDKNGVTDWDAVIDAEARRRKWLETYPESTSNDEPIIFDTSIIPWWAWIKRFHLPEAELLNGRAAMVGFFMSYFVDSLTGLGVVDQMSNFFCKTLLFVSVLGVLFIRKNEDVETLKKLFEETTFYDKQWQATWQEDTKKE